MATFTLTSSPTDTFTGNPGENNFFEFTPTTLQSTDVINGGANFPNVDVLVMKAGGTVTASQFTNVKKMEQLHIQAGAAATNVTLTDGVVNETTQGLFTVRDGDGADTIDASAVTATSIAFYSVDGAGARGSDTFRGSAANDYFIFTAQSLTGSDVIQGNNGFDQVMIDGGGTVLATAFAGASHVEALSLLSAGGTAFLSDALVGTSDFGYFTAAGSSGSDTIDATGVTLGTTIVMYGNGGNDTLLGNSGVNWFFFTPSDLTAADTVDGNGGTSDVLRLEAAGTVTSAALTNVSQIELIHLSAGGTNITLTDAMVASSDAGAVGIVDLGGNDTVDGSAVIATQLQFYAGAGTDHFIGGGGVDVFTFDVADITSADQIEGNGGIDYLVIGGAGGTAAATALNNVTGINFLYLGTNTSATLTNSFVAGSEIGKVFVVGTTGNTVDGSGVTNGIQVEFFGGGSNNFSGGNGVDVFHQSGSGSTMSGGAGGDLFFVDGTGTNIVNGDAGDDHLYTSNFAATDEFHGGADLDFLRLTQNGQSLDVTASAARISGTDVIWMLGTTGTTVTLSDADIALISDADELYIVGDADNTALIGNGWAVIATDVENPAVAPGLQFTHLQKNGHDLFVGEEVVIGNAINVPPTTVSATYGVTEDGAITATLGATDTDSPDVDFSLFGTPVGGTVTAFDAETGLFTFTPDANFTGTASFQFTATDGIATSVPGTITINVAPVNDAPVANADIGTAPTSLAGFSTNEDTPVTVNLLTNDTDVDGTVVAIGRINGTVLTTIGQSIGVVGGTVVWNGGGSVTFTPGSNSTQDAFFNYTAKDNTGAESAQTTVVIDVISVNDNPTAVANTVTVTEDTPTNINLLANDTDVEPGTLSYDTINGTTIPPAGPFPIVVNVPNGTVTVSGASAPILFTPASNFNGGPVSFNYTIRDSQGGVSGPAAVTITVTSVNDAPTVTGAATATVDEDAVNPASVNLLSGASDVDGGTLSAGTVTQTGGRTLVYTSDATSLQFDPNQFNDLSDGDSINLSFSYTISDGQGGTVPQILTLTITGSNDGVSIDPLVADVQEDLVVVVNGNVLDDVVDADVNDTHIITGVAAGTPPVAPTGGTGVGGAGVAGDFGTLTIDQDGNAQYVLDNNNLSVQELGAGESRTDTFTFSVSDQHGSEVSTTVTFTVFGTNDGPAAVLDTGTLTENAASVLGDVLANDTDVDANDLLTVAAVNGSGAGVGDNVAGLYGTLILNDDGTYTYSITSPGVQGLAAGESLVDTFNYTVSDGNGGLSTASLNITITGVNDAPVATDQSVTTDEDLAVSGLIGATDVDGDDLAYALVGANGGALNGTVEIDPATGQYTYTPNANFFGDDEFTVTVSDGIAPAVPVTVSVTVDPINDAPVAVADSFTTDEDQAATLNLVANDTDVDGGALTIASINGVALGATPQGINVVGGTLFWSGSGGSIEFTPNQDSTVQGFFTYTVKDSAGAESAQASVLVDINSLNDAPVAANNTFTVTEDTPTALSLLANDTDADGDGLRYDTIAGTTIPTGPAGFPVVISITGGTLTLSSASSQTVLFTPASNFNGSVPSFTYTAKDPFGVVSNSATVNITVSGVNDAPTARPDFFSVAEDTAVAFNVITNNDSDVEGGPLTVTTFNSGAGVTNAGVFVPVGTTGAQFTVLSNGDVVLNQNGAYEFLRTGETRNVSFSYTLSDGTTTDITGAVLTINGVNDAPTLDLNGPAAGEDFNTTATSGDTNTAVASAPAVTDGVADAEGRIKTITLTLAAVSGGLDTGEAIVFPASFETALETLGIATVTSTSSTITITATTAFSPDMAENIISQIVHANPDTTFNFNAEDRTVTVTVTDLNANGNPNASDTQTTTIDMAANVIDTTGVNTFVGANRADTIQGSTGSDTMEGRGGNDTIWGGLATGENDSAAIDTAKFTGNAGEYTITRVDANTYTVQDNNPTPRDGTDTVHDIEVLDFADVDLQVGAPILVFDATGTQLLATYAANQLDQAVAFADAATGANIIELDADQGPFSAGAWPVVIDDAVTIIGTGTGPAVIDVNGGSGFVVNPSAVNLGTETVRFENLSIEGDGTTADTNGITYLGAYSTTAGDLGNIEIVDSAVSGFGYNGISILGGGTALDVLLNGVDLSGNGYAASSAGKGDLQFFEFTGDASLTDVDVNGTTGGLAENGIAISGYQDGVGPNNSVLTGIGNVTFNGVTVTGDYAKNLTTIQGYNDFDGLDLNNVGALTLGDAGSSAAWTALFIDGGPQGGTYTNSGTVDTTIDSTLDIGGVSVVAGVYGTSPGFAVFGGRPIVLNGTQTDDHIIGTSASEVFVGLLGNDTIDSGGGDDIVVYNVGSGQDTVTDTGGIDTLGLINASDAAGTPSLTAASWNITASGTTLKVDTDAPATTDEVSATGMNAVVVQLGDGGDTVTLDGSLSGAGVSTVTVQAGLAGGDGMDVIDARTLSAGTAIVGSNLGGNDDTFRAANTTANDSVDGGAGTGDTADYSAATAAVTINLGAGTATGSTIATTQDTITNFENAIGGAGGDDIVGTGTANTLMGGDGADELTGGVDGDTLYGGTTTADTSQTDAAFYAGTLSSYQVSFDPFAQATPDDGLDATVAGGTDGGDTLHGVEILNFAGGGQLDLTANVFLYNSGGFLIGTFNEIQDAVDAAAAAGGNDETIKIRDAGSPYVEQVVVDGTAGSLDGLSIIGESDDVIIRSPTDVHETARSSSGKELNAVLTVMNATDVTVEDITVDGDGRGNTVDENDGPGQANFVGVVYRNASGGLTDVHITGVRDAYPGGTTVDGFPIQSGNQRGVGLQVDNDALMEFSMTGGSIEDFQKNATVINRADLDISGVTITGGGAQTINAQNGIQVLNSTGTISGNTIQDIGYAGPSNVYSGSILAYDNTDLDITGNTITGTNDATTNAKVVGIYIFDDVGAVSGGSVTGNTISDVDIGIGVYGNIQPDQVLVENNNISNLDLTDPFVAGVDHEPNAGLATVFDVDGSAQGDILQGATAADTLTGLGGDDYIEGRGGADNVDAGSGNDTVVWNGGDGADDILGGTETTADTLQVASNVHNLTLDGDGTANPAEFTISDGTSTATVAGIEEVEITLSAGDDVDINGDFEGTGIHVNSIEITGAAGDNTVDASGMTNVDAQNDGSRISIEFSGLGGNDIFYSGVGDDTFDGGANSDVAVFSGNMADYDITWDGTTATVTGADGLDTIVNAGELRFADFSTWLVNDNGAELTSIQSAINGADSGDQVLVANGAYNENVVLKDGVSVIGESEAGVVITGSMTTPATMSNMTLSGFTVHNGTTTSMLLDMTDTTDVTDVVFEHVTFSLSSDFVGDTPIGNGQVSGSIELHDGGDADSAGLTFRDVTMASNNHEFEASVAFVYTSIKSDGAARMVLDGVTLSGTASGTAGAGLGAQWNMTPNAGETAHVDIVNSHTSGGGNFYVSGFDGVNITGNTFTNQGLALNGAKNAVVTGNTFQNITTAIWANEAAFAPTNQHRGLVIEDAWGTSGVSNVSVHDNIFQNISAADGAIAFQRFNSGPSGVASIDVLNDVEVYTNTFTTVAEPIHLNPDFFGTDAVLPDTITTTQLLIGTTGIDSLTATNVATTIVGGPGADSLTGGTANDVIVWNAGDGNDTAINGNGGADTLLIRDTSGNDTIGVVTSGLTTVTTIVGIGGGTTNVQSVETTNLDATGGGTDTLSYAGTTSNVAVNLATPSATGFATFTGVIENVTGGSGDDTFTESTSVDNVLNGGADGADTFNYTYATGNNDTIIGGAESTMGEEDVANVNGTGATETFNVNPISGGHLGINIESGIQDVDATDANYEVRTIGVEEIVINTNGGGDSVIIAGDLGGTGVSSSTVTVNGDAGNNTFDASGVTGAQPVRVVLNGGGGSDTLRGGAGDDLLNGGDTGSNVDTAVYAHGSTGYSVTFNEGGSVTVTDTNTADGDEGTDTLTGIELLDFNGTIIDLNANVLVYDGDFSGTGAGTILGSYVTIQAAIDAASTGPGDTLVVRPGTYTENLVVSEQLKFLGANHGIGADDVDRDTETTLVGGFDVKADGVVIDGMEIEQGVAYFGQFRAGIFIDGQRDNVQVLNTIVDMAGATPLADNWGITTSFAIPANTNGLEVRDSHFADWDVGVYLQQGTEGAVVDHNSFVGNGNHLTIEDPDNATVTDNDFGASVGSKLVSSPTEAVVDLEAELGLSGNTFASDGKSVHSSFALGASGQVVLGTTLGERMNGGAGSQTFEGRGGNDTLLGGSGTDTAQYAGDVLQANITAVADADPLTMGNQAGWQVTAGGGQGTDNLVGMEIVDDANGGRFLLVGSGGFATIQEAVNAATANDTILVADGTYAGNITVNVDNLTIIGVGTGAVIQGTLLSELGITGNTGDTVAEYMESHASYSETGSHGITVAADNVRIQNLTINGTSTGIEFANGVDHVTIEDVNIRNAIDGIRKGTGARVTDVDLINGVISDSYTGIYFAKETADGADITDVTINGTDFLNITAKGLYAESLDHALITGITMNDVGQYGRGDAFGNIGEFGNGIDINLKWDFENSPNTTENDAPYSSITIQNFDFTNVGNSNGSGSPHFGGAAIAVKARDQGSYAAPEQASFSGAVIIQNGTINGTSTGIRAGEPGQNIADPDVTITNVTITGEVHNADHGDVDNVTQSPMSVTLTAGDDVIAARLAASGTIIFNGLGGADTLTGGAGNDVFIGTVDGVIDTYNGSGNTGVDAFTGTGGDTVDYSAATSDLTITLSGGAATVAGGGVGADSLTGIENLTGGAFDDELTGDAANNILIGNAGVDDLTGAGGSDRLVGGAGADNLSGGIDADYFVYGAKSDAGTAAGGQDFISGFSAPEGDKFLFDDAAFTGVTNDSGHVAAANFLSVNVAGDNTYAGSNGGATFVFDNSSPGFAGTLWFDANGNGNLNEAGDVKIADFSTDSVMTGFNHNSLLLF